MDGKRTDNKKTDNKKTDNKRTDDKKMDVKKMNDKKVDDEKVDDEKVDDEKVDDKKIGGLPREDIIMISYLKNLCISQLQAQLGPGNSWPCDDDEANEEDEANKHDEVNKDVKDTDHDDAHSNAVTKFDIIFVKNKTNYEARGIVYKTFRDNDHSGWTFIAEGSSKESFLGALEDLWAQSQEDNEFAEVELGEEAGKTFEERWVRFKKGREDQNARTLSS